MRHMKYILAAFFLFATTACAQDVNDTTMATPSCETYVEWTGTNIDNVDLSVLDDRDYRIIKPDSMVTMDYVPDRLNIHVDDDGTIIKQDCG